MKSVESRKNCSECVPDLIARAQIEVEIRYESDVLRLIVRDDGKGMDPADAERWWSRRSLGPTVVSRNGQWELDPDWMSGAKPEPVQKFD